MRARVAAVLGGALLLAVGSLLSAGAEAALRAPERNVVVRYLSALQGQRYAGAFRLLSDDERRYFGSAANFASVFRADRLRLESFRLLGSTEDPPRGTLVLVSEHVRFFDHADRRLAGITAKVAYGIVGPRARLRLKDPYHPWRAFAPEDLQVTASSVRIAVRKLSFYTGRVEVIATFQNLGDAAVTLLPYGHSVMRDDTGKAYLPIATRLPGLTDKTLFTGLRLPGSGQYTGTMTFATPDRFVPKTLSFTFAPELTDGGDAPFEVALPTFALPST